MPKIRHVVVPSIHRMGSVRQFLLAHHSASLFEGWTTVIWDYNSIEEYIHETGSVRMKELYASVDDDYAVLKVEIFRVLLPKHHDGMYADSRVSGNRSLHYDSFYDFDNLQMGGLHEYRAT